MSSAGPWHLGGVSCEELVQDRIVAYTFISVAAASLGAACVLSAVYGLLIIISFAVGFGILAYTLESSPDKHLPNFLPNLKHEASMPPASDPPAASLQQEPWKDLKVPAEIDKAIEELLERLLQEYVYVWYGEISFDEAFVQQLRRSLRTAVAAITRRCLKVELVRFVRDRLLPCAVVHADAMLLAEHFATQHRKQFRAAFFDYISASPGGLHQALESREEEAKYLYSLAQKIVPYLTSKKDQECRPVDSLFCELFSGAVLQPSLDALADPDVLNYLIYLTFHQMPSRSYPEASGRNVELLQNFIAAHQQPPSSALHLDLSAILKNQQTLFAFMQFLKEGNGLNELQFCLSVEDFNKRIMDPHLNPCDVDELGTLHADALVLFNRYLTADAAHKVGVSQELCAEIFRILDGPVTNIMQLCTTTPLFKAYEEVYSYLEMTLCPQFHRSIEYFVFLLGQRHGDTSDNDGKNGTRKWKVLINTIRRLPLPLFKPKVVPPVFYVARSSSPVGGGDADLPRAEADQPPQLQRSEAAVAGAAASRQPIMRSEAAVAGAAASRQPLMRSEAAVAGAAASRQPLMRSEAAVAGTAASRQPLMPQLFPPAATALRGGLIKSASEIELARSTALNDIERQRRDAAAAEWQEQQEQQLRAHASSATSKSMDDLLFDHDGHDQTSEYDGMVDGSCLQQRRNSDDSANILLSAKTLSPMMKPEPPITISGGSSAAKTVPKSHTLPPMSSNSSVGGQSRTAALQANKKEPTTFIGKQVKKSLSLIANPAQTLSRLSNTLIDGKRANTCDRHKNDGGNKASESIGKGLTKIKHGMLGKSMEGMVDTNLPEPAFDLADMFEDDSSSAPRLRVGGVGGVGGGGGGGGVAALSGFGGDYRDLSAWRIAIPRLSTVAEPKACFVFVIEVQRIDITAQRANAEDLHWSVQRRHSEFYALENKLTEFHGDFEGVKLPAKAKLFAGKGLDVMQAKRQPFEEYLQNLLVQPSLRESDILFTFLTSPEEFTVAALNLNPVKVIKQVKLTKEKGQGLQPFIKTFLSSTQPPPPKPRYDWVVSAEIDKHSERRIPEHPVFHDNAKIYLRADAPCSAFYKSTPSQEVEGFFDTLAYIAIKFFNAPVMMIQILTGMRLLLRNTADGVIQYVLANKFKQILAPQRISYYFQVLQGVLFDVQTARTDDDKDERKHLALKSFQSFLKPRLQLILGKDKFASGTEKLFLAFQDPVLNKQLVYQILDLVLVELFPESTKIANECD